MIYALSAIISIMAMPISAVQPVRNEEQPMQGSASQSEAATSTSPSDGIRKAITPESHRDQHGVTSMSPSDGIRKAITVKNQLDQHGVDNAIVRRVGVQVSAQGGANMALGTSALPVKKNIPEYQEGDSSGECLDGYESILNATDCAEAKNVDFIYRDFSGWACPEWCVGGVSTAGFGADACITGGVVSKMSGKCPEGSQRAYNETGYNNMCIAGGVASKMGAECPEGTTRAHNKMLFPKGCYAHNESKRVFFTGNKGGQGDGPGNQMANFTWSHGARTFYVLCKKCDATGCLTDAPTESPTADPTANPTATPTDSPTDSPTESPTADPITAALRCKAILNEHWAAGIDSATATALVGNKSGVWNDNFKQGETRVLSGAGNHGLGELENKVSSVKVEGQCCLARAFSNSDCSGSALASDDRDFIAYNTKVGDLAEGVVTPAEELLNYWGCNDCARCIQLEYNCAPS